MIEQRTEEWQSERAGKITASRFSDAISMKEVVIQRESKKEGREKITEMRPTEARNTYMREIVAEILSGRPRHQVDSKSLGWGRDSESYAREAYEIATGNVVTESGFITHPDYQFIGCSPDGLIGTDGGYESKCPHSEEQHIKNMLYGMPDDHKDQVQGCMMVTGRKWWEFISYDSRQSEPYRLYIQRIERDDQYIDTVLLPGLLAFWKDVKTIVHRLEMQAE